MAVAGFQVSYSPLPGTIDSMSAIANPHPVNAASLQNGRKYFAINCAPCHGDKGMGDGPATNVTTPSSASTIDIV
jgi:mono/diheme cytochrome c family protein